MFGNALAALVGALGGIVIALIERHDDEQRELYRERSRLENEKLRTEIEALRRKG